MKAQLCIALKIFTLLTILLGLIYPLFITSIAQLAFYRKANGSLIIRENRVIGSELIGQKFDSVAYFSSRPSATGYSAIPSGASNLGQTSARLKQQVADRKAHWIEFNELPATKAIPSEMLFASASGLDPHISPRAAFLQVARISKARNFNEKQKNQVIQLIRKLQESAQFGLLGEERVNVLLLNLNLDKIQ